MNNKRMLTPSTKGNRRGLGLFVLLVLFSLSFPFAYAQADDVTREDIGGGLFYNIRSGIFQWFEKLADTTGSLQTSDVSTSGEEANASRLSQSKSSNTIQSIYVSNVAKFEQEKPKNRAYYRELNRKRELSQDSDSEPPYELKKICLREINGENVGKACSCGDGICASYEDKCDCPIDCGFCSEGNVCNRGICEEYVPNTCFDKVCDEGEEKTCPWDCNVPMVEEEEEILSPEEQAEQRKRAGKKAKALVEEALEEKFVEVGALE